MIDALPHAAARTSTASTDIRIRTTGHTILTETSRAGRGILRRNSANPVTTPELLGLRPARPTVTE